MADPARKVYVFVISGHLILNGQSLEAGDQARIEGEGRLAIEARGESELILVDVPERP